MDNVINILGGSQTFLGVLATIIVLFILALVFFVYKKTKTIQKITDQRIIKN